MKFKVLAGSHSKGGQLIGKGKTFEDDQPLDEIFSGKFLRVSESKPAEKKPSAPKTAASKKPIVRKPVNADKEFDIDFKEVEMTVQKLGNDYFVYDIDEDDKPLNAKALKKNEVADFIASQCED